MKLEKGFAVFGATVLILLLVPFSAILNGFVLTKVWNWFMPHFGVVDITIPVAIGLSVIPALFRTPSNKKSDMSFSQSATALVGGPLFVLLFGYIVSLFL